jgi:hypothetical protein
MSASLFVCAHRGCGIPLSTHRRAWRHALGRMTGAIPPSRRHKPVPVLREDYDRAYGLRTPVEEARALLAKFRAQDEEIQNARGKP